MKTKKCGVYAALAAALLLTAALVTSCPEALSLGGFSAQDKDAAFQPPEGKQPAVFQPDGTPVVFQPSEGTQPVVTQPVVTQPPPEGKAYLTVNFGSSSNGRTITPTFVAHHYVMSIHRTDNPNPAEPDSSITITGSTSGSITATSGGIYSVTVTAYADSTNTKAIATGTTESDITVASSGETPASVTLSLITSTASTENGVFKWNIVLPTASSSYSAATIKLSSGPAVAGVTGADDDDITGLLADNTDEAGVTVPAGVYYVTVKVTGATGYADYTKMDLVHIYGYMTTTYADTMPALAENTYTVTYADYDGRGISTTDADPTKRLHGSTIPNHYPTPTLHSSVATTTMLGHVFDQWYKNTGLTIPWVFANDKIIRPITLYGKWIVPIGIGVTITNPTTEHEFVLNTGDSNTTISQAVLETNPNVVITADIDTDVWENLEWYHGTTKLTGSGSSIALNFALDESGNMGLPLPPGQSVTITLYADKKDGGVKYSGTLTLTFAL